jgi:hypothetical protein
MSERMLASQDELCFVEVCVHSIYNNTINEMNTISSVIDQKIENWCVINFTGFAHFSFLKLWGSYKDQQKKSTDYRMSQKDVYTRLIFRIILCIHLFGTLCIYVGPNTSLHFEVKMLSLFTFIENSSLSFK